MDGMTASLAEPSLARAEPSLDAFATARHAESAFTYFASKTAT
jgi:hypothetical protein